MKILHIGEYVTGGVATYIKTLIKGSNSRDIDNYIILSKNKSDLVWPLDVDHIRFYQYYRSIKYVLPAILHIRTFIREVKPDIIYCHSTWAGVLGRTAKFISFTDASVIYNAHGWCFLRETTELKKKIYALIERLLYVGTDKIINVSEYEYRAAVDRGIPSHKMVRIYSGIDKYVRVGEADMQLKIDKINLLYVGRFDRPKGVDYLIESFNKCFRDDLHLTIIGDNTVDDNSKYLIEKKNTDKITFLGWIKHDDIDKFYKSCDIVVVPSRWEAFGLVAIEAMKYSKPVIASDRGALPEIIKNGVNGYVFSYEDNSLIRILSELSREKILKLSVNCEKIFLKNFTSDLMVAKTVEMYRTLKGKK